MNRPVPTTTRGKRDTAGAPQRILLIAADLSSGGGVNKVIGDLAVLFRSRLGAEVEVANARSDAPPTYGFPGDVPVRSYGRTSLLAYFALLLRLRRSRPDVVIGSWTQDNVLMTLAFAGSRTKVIAVEHAPWHFQPLAIRLLRRIAYPLASRVVVLNRADLAHYRRFLSNVSLIPNPVEAPTRPPGGQREKLILAVGHLEPNKNFQDAIQAMARSRLEANGWSLAIIGSGSASPCLLNLIDKLGLTRTRIHSPTDDLASWYARASLLVVPSRAESFSLVLAEAMRAGVVPVAYASDGPSFILEDFPAHLVPIGDLDRLTEQLSHFANLPDLSIIREALRRSVELRFSSQTITEAWEHLLG